MLIVAVVLLPGILFGGGSGDDDDFDFPPVTGSATTTTVPGDRPVETFDTFSDKNPFAPLVDVAAPSGDATPPDQTGTTSTVPSSGFPDEGPPPTFPDFDDDGGVDGNGGGQSTPTTQAGPPPPPPRQPDRVSLLEVFTDQGGTVVASVRVNDVTHQVAEGDEFATSYRVLDLDIGSRCAQLLFGDDRFGLCEGEETLK